MIKQKKICVVGCGYWGKNHVKTLHDLGSLGGVVEPNKDIKKQIQNTYENVLFFDNLTDSFNENFDGYVVATPVETHYKISKKIIEHGFHVLIEKPITLTLSDALILKELSIKNKEIIDSNQLGKIQYIYSNRLNLGKIRTEENVFWSFAPHDIALFQYLINDFPKNITSIGSDIFNRGIHDTTITTFEYPNGIMAHIFVSWLHPFKEHRFIVIGEKGMLSFEDSIAGKPLVFYNKTVQWENNSPNTNIGSNHYIEYLNKLPLKEELKYFIENLDNDMFEISNCDTGIEVIKILESATKSLKGVH